MVNLKYLQNFRGKKPKKKAKKDEILKKPFWVYWPFEDLKYHNIINNLPLLFSFKTKAMGKALLGFVDKTPKKMRTVFEIIEPNISSLHRVNTQSIY